MPKYIVRDTMPCYVSFLYEVEADSKDQALRRYREEHGHEYLEAK